MTIDCPAAEPPERVLWIREFVANPWPSGAFSNDDGSHPVRFQSFSRRITAIAGPKSGKKQGIPAQFPPSHCFRSSGGYPGIVFVSIPVYPLRVTEPIVRHVGVARTDTTVEGP